ncbi:hypothetical protein OS122_02520 [Mycolicibacterium mucogenicum]|uniref:phage tail termination protein n=1 Tax=Mycolicibacterium mucogenicum TaxID=56689 RepID=UPI002269AC11|nr:hypothetical protein [Mycolicibacterium mucogenicum]MCX8559773.1 hypothetical protein [Mycolicibacterium mucogenicum]
MTAISYPDWWDRDQFGYPNAENLLKTLLVPLISGITVTPWLPSESVIEQTLDAGGGFLRIYRTGGRVNYEQKRDEPNVQLAALTKSRDASWDLIEFARTGVLAQFEKPAVVPGTQYELQCLGEVVGPQLIPAEMRDERLVPATFMLHTWRLRSNSLRQALGL